MGHDFSNKVVKWSQWLLSRVHYIIYLFIFFIFIIWFFLKGLLKIHAHNICIYMLRPICEIAQFMNWAALLPSSWNGQQQDTLSTQFMNWAILCRSFKISCMTAHFMNWARQHISCLVTITDQISGLSLLVRPIPDLTWMCILSMVF